MTTTPVIEHFDAVAAFVASSDTVGAHQPLHKWLAAWKSANTNLCDHARRSVGADNVGMNLRNQRLQPRIGQPLLLVPATTLPSAIAVHDHAKDLVLPRQELLPALRVNPDELYRQSFAEDAAVFFDFQFDLLTHVLRSLTRELRLFRRNYVRPRTNQIARPGSLQLRETASTFSMRSTALTPQSAIREYVVWRSISNSADNLCDRWSDKPCDPYVSEQLKRTGNVA